MSTVTEKLAPVGFHGDDHGTAKETFQGYVESHFLVSYEAKAKHTSKLIFVGQKNEIPGLDGQCCNAMF